MLLPPEMVTLTKLSVSTVLANVDDKESASAIRISFLRLNLFQLPSQILHINNIGRYEREILRRKVVSAKTERIIDSIEIIDVIVSG